MGLDIQTRLINVPDTSYSVELYLYDFSGKEFYRDLVLKMVSIIIKFILYFQGFCIFIKRKFCYAVMKRRNEKNRYCTKYTVYVMLYHDHLWISLKKWIDCKRWHIILIMICSDMCAFQSSQPSLVFMVYDATSESSFKKVVDIYTQVRFTLAAWQ